MSLWSYSDNKWVINDWRNPQAGTAVLACPGPSLTKAPEDMRGPNRTVFAVNSAYPRVKPDVWIGMDSMDCYHPNLAYESFPKVFRGNYHAMKTSKGDEVRSLPFNYFADVTRCDGVGDILTRSSGDLKLVWFKHSLAAALHLIVWMGYKRIVFTGCDMGGKTDYYDDRVLTRKQHAENRRLYKQQIGFLKQFVHELSGIECVSSTPDSPINDFMVYHSIDNILSDKIEEPVRLKHATEAFEEVPKKIGVVTPTRGDRPEFMEMCKLMIRAQSVQPHFQTVVDYAPEIEGNDQRDRVIKGVAEAKAAGCTHVLVMEDDDYYQPDFIEKTLAAWGTEEIIGGFYYDIYHIGARKHIHYHGDMDFGTGVKGAPLHSTGFSISAWDTFVVSGYLNKKRNLDDDLWTWAQDNDITRTWLKEHTVLSIKHGIGKSAGGSHQASVFDNKGEADPDGEYLASIVGNTFKNLYFGSMEPKVESLPLVSVITVCYGDYHKYEVEYMEMIAKQTHKNVEMILVDEEMFTPADHQLPIAAGRNIGVAKSKGEYLVFVDVDDVLYPEYISKVVDSGSDLVVTHTNITGLKPMKHQPKPGITLDQFAIGSQYVSIFACKREAFLRTRGYDETMSGWEDHELWMQFVKLGYYVDVIPELLCEYRRTSAGLGTHCWNIKDTLNAEIKGRYPELYPSSVTANPDPYGAHLPVLEFLRPIWRERKVFEVGVGKHSTPYLLTHAESLLSIEEADAGWLDKVSQLVGAAPCWTSHLIPDLNDGLKMATENGPYAMSFIDGVANTRVEYLRELFKVTEFAIVGHDANDQRYTSYNWSSVPTPDGWIKLVATDHNTITWLNTKALSMSAINMTL